MGRHAVDTFYWSSFNARACDVAIEIKTLNMNNVDDIISDLDLNVKFRFWPYLTIFDNWALFSNIIFELSVAEIRKYAPLT